MAKCVRVGLLGCGVVGASVLDVLKQNEQYLSETTDTWFDVVRIAVRDITLERPMHVPVRRLTSDWRTVATAQDVDVVVEAMGSVEPARSAILAALGAGKHVVTANKMVLALHGEELYRAAASANRHLLFEASVLGGIPALHTIRSYFRGNQIQRIDGIVNGTSNYILSRMDEDQLDFAKALAEAQLLGYAEADATQDVDGYDAMYKLQILSRFAFGRVVATSLMPRTGIGQVSQADMQFVARCALRFKHIVTSQLSDGGLMMYVGPALISPSSPLYNVRHVDNAVVLSTRSAGQITLVGPGAGGLATATAIVEDLIKVATDTPAHVKAQLVCVEAFTHHAFVVTHALTLDMRRLFHHAADSSSPLAANVAEPLRTSDRTRAGTYVQLSTPLSVQQLNAWLVAQGAADDIGVFPILGDKAFAEAFVQHKKSAIS